MSDTSLVFNLVARERVSAALGKAREKFDAAATGIAASVGAALGVGVAASLDMEAANSKLAAQLGIGPAEAAQLSKVSAHVYAQAWGDSSETVNEAIRGVYNNIGDTSKAQGGLEGITTKALALSETFDQEVGPTTAAVGQLIRTGLAKNADEAFDILTVGFQSSANKADDFLDTINEYSTQFRRIGLDGQTATGLLSQGLKGGAKDADQVADAIGQFGELALAGGSTVEAAFKSIGLNADTMAAKIGKGGKTGKQALQQTLDALRGTKDEQVRLNAATALFGDPGTVMGDALLALDPAGAAAASGMDKAKGATDRLVKTAGGSAQSTLESFKRQAIVKLSEVSAGFIKFAMDNKDLMGPLLMTLGGIAGAVLLIKGGMIAWSAAQAVWTAATTIATGAQWLWNAALMASPVTWIVIAIIALIAVIVLIATKTTWFQTLWKGAWNGIKTAFWFVFGFIKNHWPLILAILTGPIGLAVLFIVKKWDTIVGFVSKLPGRIGRAAGGMWNGVKNAFRSAINWIISKWNNFSFTIGGGSVLGIDIPRVTLGTPNIPYLAKGGLIKHGGTVMVGEAGPEILSLPKGAGVTPLSRAGMGGGQITVRLVTSGAYDELLRLVRKMVVIEGGGSVESAFGRQG